MAEGVSDWRMTGSTVIAPQPIRLVGSSISVGCIIENPNLTSPMQVPKKPEEIEEEVESEALPVVVSDLNNKVTSSAYNEMIGQQEWPYLDSMVTDAGRVGGKRICRAGLFIVKCDMSHDPKILT
ncbi:hypothetical protein V6N13_065611 [Hibiscus sabdariffa]|uniref:Uncharacterized protein n=1 Tax=Hibiscus sabdariffa TaxID=183260 RepID=A0ABR2QQH6_9ROSI